MQRLAAREERVLGRGVDLDGQDVVQRGERVVQRPGHGRQAAQPERVLPPRGRLGARGERAQARRHPRQAGERAGGRDRARERLAVALQRHEAQRGDAAPGVEQVDQIRPHQRGGREGGGVGAHQRQRVARRDLQPLRPAVLPLAGQRQPELREHGEVAGPEPAEVAHRRHAVVAEHAGERGGDLGPAAAARRHLREPDEDRRPHHVLGQRVAEPARVAAQEPQRVAAEVAEDVDVPVGADARGAPVDGPHGRDLLGRAVAGDHPLARRGRELHVEGAAACRRHEGRGRERVVPDAQRHAVSRSSSCRSSASSPTSRTSSGSPRCAAARSAAARVAGVGCWASQSTRV